VSASLWERHRAACSSYEIVEAGFNYRIDDPRAALVSARLRRLDADNARRAELDAAYREAFAGESGLAPTAPPPAGERASHCLFTVVLDPGIDRDAFRLSLAERGVQTSMHFPLLHLSPAYAGRRPNLPLTEEYGRRAVTLPIFPQMQEWQQELVIDATRKALASQRASIVG
jgi:dTDP-4-amino-4,6-dideoxygalactose transaminase